MVVIRIKDSSGKWVNIPALDGERGAFGKVPNITLQTYSSTNAEVQQSGTAENPVIKLGLPKATGGDTSNCVTLTGNRGVVANYASCNVAVGALTIDQNASEYNQLTNAGTITVVDGAANTEWCKTVMIVDANTAIEFGENWNWIGDELPTITPNCVLVCYWCNNIGMARVIDGATYSRMYKGTITNNGEIVNIYRGDQEVGGNQTYVVMSGTNEYALAVGDRFGANIGIGDELQMLNPSNAVGITVSALNITELSEGFSLTINPVYSY